MFELQAFTILPIDFSSLLLAPNASMHRSDGKGCALSFEKLPTKIGMLEQNI